MGSTHLPLRRDGDGRQGGMFAAHECYTHRQLLVALLIAAVVGFVSSFIPSYNAARVNIVDGLAAYRVTCRQACQLDVPDTKVQAIPLQGWDFRQDQHKWQSLLATTCVTCGCARVSTVMTALGIALTVATAVFIMALLAGLGKGLRHHRRSV